MSAQIVLPCSRPNWGSVKVILDELLFAPVYDKPIDKACKQLTEAHKMLLRDEEDSDGSEGRMIRELAIVKPIDWPKLNAATEKRDFGPYAGLRHYLKRTRNDNVFISLMLNPILRLVLSCEKFEENGPPLSVIPKQSEETVVLSRHFVACINACAFLGYFPESGELGAGDEDFDFASLWQGSARVSSSNGAKIDMILNYFEQLDKLTPKTEPTGNITMRRLVLPKDDLLTADNLTSCSQDLCPFFVKEDGSIEDAGRNVLQVDFANEYIGGGVLTGGNVQEEIRFSICPELLASILIMAPMDDNEAIVIQGFERFSKYAGYGNDLRFVRPYDDSKSKSPSGEFLTTLVAIDAQCYMGASSIHQYKASEFFRDLNKAYIGFRQPYLPNHDQPPETSNPEWYFKLDPTKTRTIATGNWGCGVFGGDPQFKAALQWLAATLAKCPALVYYTFGDQRMDELPEIVNLVQQLKWTVKDLYEAVTSYGKIIEKKRRKEQSFFEYILDEYAGEDK